VKLAIEAGIPTAIASGRRARQIAAIMNGKAAGTRFIAAGEAKLR
jgi:glutamate 5-kinase